jgi:tetratricopeptide (TPR) repeat protein
MDLFEEATEHHKNGRYAEAEKLYDMLLSQNHDNAGLLATMGTLYLQTSRYGLAIHMLEAAKKHNLIQSDVLSNLSLAYKNSGQSQKAIEYIEKACAIPDPCAGALANYSGFFTNTGTPDKAIALCTRALEKEPELVVAHWNLALALLENGEWARGWEEHEWGLKPAKHITPMRVDRKIGELPQWDGMPGKTVAVYGEQGLGDEIMFASMLPDLMATSNVIIECHKRLVPLFERSFGVTCYGTREDTSISWPFDHQIDYRVSIGSLGKFFRRSADAFPGTPYLKTEAAPRDKKFRVGISWTGGSKAGRILTRTVPLSWWQPILENDCEFVSLQYTDQAAEIEIVEKLGYPITQYPFMTDRTLDYDETAKVVASCDLVISVCTSVVHLAGALGVPCWVMTPNKPAWRYGTKGRMPWYRSVRLYRQQPNDPWNPVIERIADDLAALVKTREPVMEAA